TTSTPLCHSRFRLLASRCAASHDDFARGRTCCRAIPSLLPDPPSREVVMRRLLHVRALYGAVTVVALGAAWPHSAQAQDHEHPAGDPAKLGRVTFPVSCAEAVRPRFERAVAIMHSFWFE